MLPRGILLRDKIEDKCSYELSQFFQMFYSKNRKHYGVPMHFIWGEIGSKILLETYCNDETLLKNIY